MNFNGWIVKDARYYRFCEEAARNPEVFINFKRNQDYLPILECVPEDEGQVYLDIIKERYGYLLKDIELFKENDNIGNPTRYTYAETGMISPTTLRYIKVLGDLISNFKDLNDLNIVEIGPGYGGLCNIISKYFNFKSYTIFDLVPCVELAKKYLTKCVIQNVQGYTLDEAPKNKKYDLVISNYAYSELTPEYRKKYIKEVISKSRRGYFQINPIDDKDGIDIINELKTVMTNYRTFPDDGNTYKTNYIIAFNNDTNST